MAPSPKSKTPRVDEDLDDLDDVLEQFSSPQKAASPAEPPKTSAPQPLSRKTETSNSSVENPLTDAFAEEFAKGMESLLKELGDGAFEPGKTQDKEQEKVFSETWKKIMEGMEPTTSTAASTAKPAQKGLEESFQERIGRSMDKMKEGESSLKSNDGNAETALEELWSSLGKMEGDGEPEEGLEGLVEHMMFQLMSKEVLYEPLKEMHEKFPGYLTENKDKLSEQDRARYAKQQEIVSKVVATFEDKDYSEDDPGTLSRVMSLMTEMQEHGAPPAEIMGDLPPGMTLGPDGLPQFPQDCCIA